MGGNLRKINGFSMTGSGGEGAAWVGQRRRGCEGERKEERRGLIGGRERRVGRENGKMYRKCEENCDYNT